MSVDAQSQSTAIARAAYESCVRSAHTGAHARRTAARNAAFFLPRLEQGMRVLDVGCGPGSITLGLAAAVAPGEVVGVDVSAEVLEKARALAAERGCTNVRYERADLAALPFDAGAFDAAFAHAVLQHIGEVEQALRELHRVLRPGGLIGVADADYDGALYWPDDPLLPRSMEIVASMRQSQGDARIGKRLRALLADAGFAQVRASVTGNADGDAGSVLATGGFWSAYFAAEPFIDYAVALGVSRFEEMQAISRAWLAWSKHPGAFWGRMWCEAGGTKPT
jgi:ubiquinone/menaquinone biosynthesis C-methylase UbiE